MALDATLSISSSSPTALPDGRDSKSSLRSWRNDGDPELDESPKCPGFVRASVTEPGCALVWSKFNGTRSRGVNLGVSALATFSDNRRCRSWCQCILVRSIEKIGRSEIGIACLSRFPVDRDRPKSATQPNWLGRLCRPYG